MARVMGLILPSTTARLPSRVGNGRDGNCREQGGYGLGLFGFVVIASWCLSCPLMVGVCRRSGGTIYPALFRGQFRVNGERGASVSP